MAAYSFTGSFGYVVPLWILTGVLLVALDANMFRSRSMAREAKVSKIFGWINISAGMALMLVRWIA